MKQRACIAPMLLIAVWWIVTGCGAIQGATVQNTTLTAAQHGTTIDVQPGALIVVELAENPTTGFRWAVDDGEAAILAEHSSSFEQTSAAVGGGGLRRITFKAISTGETALKLKLWRSWEGDNSVTERFAVTVRVR